MVMEDSKKRALKRGGKRPGAGRPRGSVKENPQVWNRVGMPRETWAEIDAKRGKMSRGEYLAEILRGKAT